jgi:hypothetical protein
VLFSEIVSEDRSDMPSGFFVRLESRFYRRLLHIGEVLVGSAWSPVITTIPKREIVNKLQHADT